MAVAPTPCASPPGARDGSNRLCCASRTNGRSGDAAAPRLPLGRDDLLERPAQVHRRRLRALGRPPRDRPVERPVELEDAGPVAEPLEPPPVARRQLAARDAEQLARRHVEQHRPAGVELGERRHAAPRLDLAAERPQVRDERVRDPLRAAARERPARDVREQPEDEPERRRTAAASAAASSARRAPRTAPAPARRGTTRARARSPAAPTGAEKRASAAGCRGHTDRRRAGRRGAPPHRRRAAPSAAGSGRRRGRAPAPSRRASGGARPPSRRRTDARAPPASTSTRARAPRAGASRRTGEATASGMDRRADVVDEARQRQLEPTAGRRPPSSSPSTHAHRQARAGEHDRRGEAVRARADDGGSHRPHTNPGSSRDRYGLSRRGSWRRAARRA